MVRFKSLTISSLIDNMRCTDCNRRMERDYLTRYRLQGAPKGFDVVVHQLRYGRWRAY